MKVSRSHNRDWRARVLQGPTARRRTIAAALAAMALGACGLFPVEPGVGDVLLVENATDQPIHIFYLRPAGERDLGPVPPGSVVRVVGTPECTDQPLIARNDQGEEVARREEPICRGDTWVVEEEE